MKTWMILALVCALKGQGELTIDLLGREGSQIVWAKNSEDPSASKSFDWSRVEKAGSVLRTSYTLALNDPNGHSAQLVISKALPHCGRAGCDDSGGKLVHAELSYEGQELRFNCGMEPW